MATFKKVVLTPEGVSKMPSEVQDAFRAFQGRSIHYYDGFPTLPVAMPLPPNHVENSSECMEYVADVMHRINRGKLTKGQAKSMLQGLRTCGKVGEKAQEMLTKIIKK